MFTNKWDTCIEKEPLCSQIYHDLERTEALNEMI